MWNPNQGSGFPPGYIPNGGQQPMPVIMGITMGITIITDSISGLLEDTGTGTGMVTGTMLVTKEGSTVMGIQAAPAAVTQTRDQFIQKRDVLVTTYAIS
ncbi:hypothetical protein UPYG_G00316620 [Umbra pygmaea]|uniref:Uncharacterized protein n=1 Tax=Umbra pygmaea TaxID=75934 RepID=A0ABD0W1S1_UMBPY